MTREEAIKTLKENYCSMCAYGSCDMDSCDISYCDNREAIEVLRAVPERKKGEWIPVTEELPKENTHVIVSVMNEGKPFVTADDYFCYGFDDWKDDVVAWMKTPEPYKGGDS